MLTNTKTEFNFQELFDKAAIPLCIINKSDNKLLVNNQFRKTFGYSSKEIPTLNDWLILAYPNPDYRKFVLESCDKVIKKALNENTDFEQPEFNITCKNGDILTMLISASAVGGDFLITFFDITEKKKSNEENEMLGFALNNTSESIFIYKKDTNKFSYVNDQACRSLGYSHQELLQLSTFDIDPDITPELINKIKNKVYSGQSYIFETRHKAKNGHIFPVEIVTTQYVFNNQIYTLSLVRDISKRKENEKILQESEEKYRTLAENSPDNIMRYDKNCRTVYLNKVLEKTLNTTLNEIKNLTPTEFNSDGRFDEYEKYLRHTIETGLESVFELKVFNQQGEEQYYTMRIVPENNNDGQIVGALVIGRDITERKQAEIILRESEERFSVAFNKNPISTVIIRYSDRKYVDVNEEFLRKTGFTREEIINHTPIELGQYVDFAERDDMVKILEEQGWLSNYEFKTKNKNGQIRTQLNTTSIIKIGNEKHYLSIFHDITEKKKIEQDLIAAKEKAEESDRLKTAFLNNISHEIRTPMNAICGFSDLLNKPNLSAERRKDFTSIIQKSSNQLLSIVTDIVTISTIETKQEKLNIKKVCINNIPGELVKVFEPQALAKNLNLRFIQNLTDLQSTIYTDNYKIRQILSNLLSNAIKFTNTGSIEFGYILKDLNLEFYVADTGIGIKKEACEKIFERFIQADETIHVNYGGTGLGLSIVKGNVELLGGKIWVQSEPDKGSTFYFTVPYKLATETVETINTIQSAKNLNYGTILVAEDEEYNFLYIKELLADLDLNLIHSKNGKETVEIFMENSNIDLILMDIKMPIMTGDEATKIIKGLNPDLPIIAQSAYALEHERAKYEVLFDDYIAKPINEENLKQKIMKYIKNK